MALAADLDLVLAKVSSLRKCVATVRSLRGEATSPLEPWMVLDLTVLNPQRAAQAALDLGNHLIAANRWELPSSARRAVDILAEHDVLEPGLHRGMVGVVGFRNITVHQYADLDPLVVEAIAARGLGVLEGFSEAILGAVAVEPPG